MFTMDKHYVEARFVMLGESLGMPMMAAEVTATQPMRVMTERDFEDQAHDLKLVVSAMEGRSNQEAAAIFDGLRSQFRHEALRNGSADEVASYF